MPRQSRARLARWDLQKILIPVKGGSSINEHDIKWGELDKAIQILDDLDSDEMNDEEDSVKESGLFKIFRRIQNLEDDRFIKLQEKTMALQQKWTAEWKEYDDHLTARIQRHEEYLAFYNLDSDEECDMGCECETDY